MTKKEKRIVRDAIQEIMAEDGDFSGAMAALGALCGMVYPADTIKRTIRSADARKALLSGKNQEFKGPTR